MTILDHACQAGLLFLTSLARLGHLMLLTDIHFTQLFVFLLKVILIGGKVFLYLCKVGITFNIFIYIVDEASLTALIAKIVQIWGIMTF